VEGPRTWSGDEWQDYIMCLLRLRYDPGELVDIPDHDQGDAGLEAFAQDGCAFQCYSPEEPLTTDQRYAKHRRKMTTDLGKFTNVEKVSPIVGPTKIRRWIFVVPILDSKRLIAHAQARAAIVRALDLSYVEDDFTVVAVTDDHFPREKAAYAQLGLGEITLDIEEASVERLDDFAQATGPLIDTMDSKLAKLPALASQETRDRYRGELLRAYLYGQEARDRLRTDYPELAEPIERVIRDAAKRLVLEYGVSTASPDSTLRQLVDHLREQIRARIRGLRDGDVDAISYSAIAEWLMQCPLDFSAAS
jgi:hypothetical protein